MGNSRIRSWFKRKLFGVPLYVVILSGLAGVAVDGDHILAHLLFEGYNARFLHLPLLASAVSVILYCGARAGGLYIGMVLRKWFR